MDPDFTLRDIREIVRMVNSGMPLAADGGHEFALAEHIDDLDQWLSKGGFLPVDWITTPEISRSHVTATACQQLLWLVERDSTYAIEAGSFYNGLIMAALAADLHNLRQLARAFPAVASAVYVWKNEMDGAAYIRAKAAARA